MQVYKNRIFQGEVTAPSFERTQDGFRFSRMIGVNITTGETVSVEPVSNPVLDVSFLGSGVLIQVGWDRPKWLIILRRFKIDVEKLNDLSLDFDERDASPNPKRRR